jgi:hypothetical protein
MVPPAVAARAGKMRRLRWRSQKAARMDLHPRACGPPVRRSSSSSGLLLAAPSPASSLPRPGQGPRNPSNWACCSYAGPPGRSPPGKGDTSGVGHRRLRGDGPRPGGSRASERARQHVRRLSESGPGTRRRRSASLGVSESRGRPGGSPTVTTSIRSRVWSALLPRSILEAGGPQEGVSLPSRARAQLAATIAALSHDRSR